MSDTNAPRSDTPEPGSSQPGPARARLPRGEAEAARQAGQGPDALLEEFRIQQIELTMQNDELRRAQRELAESRDRYAALYDAAPVGYLTLDSNRQITSVNQTGAVMLQRERHRLMDWMLELLAVEAHRTEVVECIRQAGGEERSARRDVQFIREHADPLWVQMNVVAHRLGQAVTYRVTLTDISQRKQAEQASERNRELLAGIIDTIPAMIAIYDPDMRKFRFNRELRRILGWNESDAADGNFMARVYPDEAYRRDVAEFMRSADKQWRDIVATAKDGSEVESSWANIRLGDETWVGIGVDMRQRNRDRRRLEELNHTLEQRVAERTDVLKHTVDQLQAEVRRRDAAEKELRDLNEQLQQRAEQLELLTEQIGKAEERQRRQLATILHDDLQQVLAGAKYRVGLLAERVRQGVDLGAAAEDIAQLLTQAIRQARGLSHELNPPGLAEGYLSAALRWLGEEMQSLHGLEVDVDVTDSDDPGDEMVRVFSFRAAQEMLFNVVKHAETSHARLAAYRQDGLLHVVVEDSGRGFDAETIWSGSTHVGGIGLLTIRERATMLGGKLDITSAAGQGSVFHLRLPC